MTPHDELPELDANELALLAAFHEEEQLGASTHERVKARVLETTTPVPPTGTVLRGPWAPWVAGTVLAAAAAALLVFTVGDTNVTAVNDRALQQAPDTPESAAGVRARQETPTTHKTTTGPRRATPDPARPEPVPTEVLSAPVLQPEPAPKAKQEPPAPSRRPASAPRNVPVAEVPALPSSTSLADETKQLDRARRAVVQGRPKDALSLLRDAEARFPDGILRQERAALRVVALCDSGDLASGRKAAAAFLRAHPQSALRSRVHSACPESTP
ncbi:MAG: hypothetical protein ACRBN8_43005 [Nannocystales bacterium]